MTVNRVLVVRTIVAKEIRIERNSRVLLNQVVPFALVVMVLFAFALDNEGILQRVAPGLVWLATLFSMLVMVQRNFAVEQADGALDNLRSAGIDGAALFLGKTLALAVQLVVIETLLVMAAVVLYAVELGVVGLIETMVTLLAAALALGAVGTLYGGFASGVRGRETLLPLLVLPVTAPVLIGSTRAMEAAFESGGAQVSEGWAWIALVAVFAATFSIVGSLAFGSLIEE